MTDLLLISVNCERTPYPVFPVGVWVLSAYLTRLGYSVEVADLNLLRGLEELEECFLNRKSYRYIGLSVRNIDNLSWPDSVSYLPEIQACVQLVKRVQPVERIVIGGAGYSIFGQALLDELGLVHGLCGEGEQSLARLLGASGPLPAPDYSYARETPVEVLLTYYRQSGMLGLQTRRGCPLHCDYCTYPAIEGNCFRLRPVESVLDEMTYLASIGIEVFYVVDCLVNLPMAYTLTLLDALAWLPPRVRWYGFASPEHFDEPFVERLLQGHCAGLELGSESGSDRVLRAMHKTFGTGDILRASEACRALRLKFCHYLMLGEPEEDEASVRESMELMDQCDPSTVIISVGIRLYPNTPLQVAYQAAYPTDVSLLPPVFLQPPKIGLPDILALCKKLARKTWIYPGVTGSMDASQMDYLRARGIKGPLWDYL
ncbi:MAG: radical SAM protein [Kiritimatiellae bacterium]|nr:radical SAM protein [Kiritimatiellia bacterium]